MTSADEPEILRQSSIMSNDDLFWNSFQRQDSKAGSKLQQEFFQTGQASIAEEVEEEEEKGGDEPAFLNHLDEAPRRSTKVVRKSTKVVSNADIKKAFLFQLIQGSDLFILKDMMMHPVPEKVGYLQFSIHRDKSGINKMFPVYKLKLSDASKTILLGDKIGNSATSHYKISVSQEGARGIKVGKKEDAQLGRLRANMRSSDFFLFDNGMNPKDVKKPEHVARR